MNKTIRITGIALTSIFLMGAQVFYKSATFKVVASTKRTYYPGVQGSPITTTFSFNLIFKNCGHISIDSFWADGKTDKVDLVYQNHANWDEKPMQGDTVRVSCSYYNVPEQEDFPNRPRISGSMDSKPPVSHKGKILFRYKMKGNTYYYSILNVAAGQNVYAP